jgi:hypothetical protein
MKAYRVSVAVAVVVYLACFFVWPHLDGGGTASRTARATNGGEIGVTNACPSERTQED